MILKEILSLCESKRETKEEYTAVRGKVYQEVQQLSEEERMIVGDALEELEMTIEWMK